MFQVKKLYISILEKGYVLSVGYIDSDTSVGYVDSMECRLCEGCVGYVNSAQN